MGSHEGLLEPSEKLLERAGSHGRLLEISGGTPWQPWEAAGTRWEAAGMRWQSWEAAENWPGSCWNALAARGCCWISLGSCWNVLAAMGGCCKMLAAAVPRGGSEASAVPECTVEVVLPLRHLLPTMVVWKASVD
ncbi:hypothetical protein L3X38_009358 [Prunus dulcis]|uniref:Uncharacterized protein n=1 Tax=Prunus dulcis TaxID=3755 RepID=A0AAD5F7R4_PRUDU|nr:hypothetical protein L3X38_009358 [Prunus dulcis]